MSKLVSETRLMWGMPVTVAIVSQPESAPRAQALIAATYDYFAYVDDHFSTYKPESEISLINAGSLSLTQASTDMQTVFHLADDARVRTGGYFDISHEGKFDPLGLVKGWALSNAARMLHDAGFHDFFVDGGGDFQAAGMNAEGRPWRVGIRNSFNTSEIVKVLAISDGGVATSGTYIRGQHIYNPLTGGLPDPDIVSITVVGPDVYDADCYATAAFAMGRKGIEFIQSLDGFEGYMIDAGRRATFTSGFGRYLDHENNR